MLWQKKSGPNAGRGPRNRRTIDTLRVHVTSVAFALLSAVVAHCRACEQCPQPICQMCRAVLSSWQIRLCRTYCAIICWPCSIETMAYHIKMKMALPAPLSADLAAMVHSYSALVSGVAWDDSVVNALLAQAAANEASCTFCVHVQIPEHGDAEVAIEIHSPLCKCKMAQAYAMVSIYWSIPDTTVWESTRPATNDGLLQLLLDVRRIIRCMQHGPCAQCMAKHVPEHNLRLTPTSDCLSCVLASFFTT